MTHTLEAGAGGPGFRASIRSRVAAHEALTSFFRLNDGSPPRSALGRFLGRDVLTAASRPLYSEVQAQLAIADTLAGLDDDWTVLNAVPMASLEKNIDHLVIGPGGVFALAVVNHSDQSVQVAHGKFEVAGSKHNHIRESEFEVGWVERLLGATIQSTVIATGVVVVVDPRSVVVHAAPRDVAIVPSRDLVAWLQTQPMKLSVADVDRFVQAAECPATWMNGEMPDDDGADLRSRFLEVVRSAKAARSVRRLWIVGTISVIAATFSLWACALVMLE